MSKDEELELDGVDELPSFTLEEILAEYELKEEQQAPDETRPIPMEPERKEPLEPESEPMPQPGEPEGEEDTEEPEEAPEEEPRRLPRFQVLRHVFRPREKTPPGSST